MHYKSIYGKILKNLFLVFHKPILSSKYLTRCIFNVNPIISDNKKIGRFYWDLTTLILKKALPENVKDDQDVLEIGTGEFGILSIFIAKKRNINITSTDIKPLYVEHVKEIARNNKVNINIQESDLFSNIKGLYDVIFWNIPYVPTDFGKEFYKIDPIDARLEFTIGWDGGFCGLDNLDSFLKEAPNFLKKDGKIIAGINTFFVPIPRIRETIKKYGLNIISVYDSIVNPSKAFVIKA